MHKSLTSWFLIGAILLGSLQDANAGKSYSSSSSSRSSGRSSSFGRSSSSPSRSSGSSGKGSSFSFSGSKSSTPSRAYSPSSPSKYSSSSSSPSKPISKYSSSSSSPSPSPAVTGSNGSKYSSSSGSGAKYSPSSPPPKTGPPENSRKPTSTSFNSNLSDMGKSSESKKRYEASTAPKSTYKTHDGTERPISASSPQVKTVRNYVTHERYVTYDNRASGFYGSYYSHPVYYHDSYSPFLMGWILSDAINSHDRALWLYHHQADMDQARYNEMLRRDARLQAEINQLKAQNLAQDPGYIPPQMQDNPDLMYNREFVDASYNPVEVPVAQSGSGSVGRFFFWAFVTFACVVIGGIVIYFVAMKEY